MEIITKGIRNYHVLGVDSVVLRTTEEGRLRRAFVAHVDHDLDWKDGLLSLGFHANHCDIKIEVVSGAICNVNMGAGRGAVHNPNGYLRVSTFEYVSPILSGGKGSFSLLAQPQEHQCKGRWLLAGHSLSLLAREVHTIYIPGGQEAIWVVTEGAEDPHYIPLVYTNRDLTRESFSGMYQAMKETEVNSLITRVDAQYTAFQRGGSSCTEPDITNYIEVDGRKIACLQPRSGSVLVPL